jgi:hypothetical protein
LPSFPKGGLLTDERADVDELLLYRTEILVGIEVFRRDVTKEAIILLVQDFHFNI